LNNLNDRKKDRIKGIVGTVLIHAAVIALLILLGFTTPLPLPEEEGVEVNLGYTNQGMGTIQPKEIPPMQQTAPPPKPQPKQEVEEVVTQDIEEAPAIEETKEPKIEEVPVEETPVIEEVVEEVVKEEPKVNPAAIYKGKTTQETESGSEGITGQPGDQGKPTGTIDAKDYLGKGGFGDGPSYSLGGRTHRLLPSPTKDFSENGTVVVQITVNRAGKVVKAVAIDKGSNTTNTKLRKLAEEAAKKAIFNPKPDAAEFQRGTITYHFIVKN
jgi:TonB family protein